uniref:Uncharacterized protein n=1 Tax=Knipowitschia caucasica TaxID=637954 RepID=A0AAV2LE34_KNICA
MTIKAARHVPLPPPEGTAVSGHVTDCTKSIALSSSPGSISKDLPETGLFQGLSVDPQNLDLSVEPQDLSLDHTCPHGFSVEPQDQGLPVGPQDQDLSEGPQSRSEQSLSVIASGSAINLYNFTVEPAAGAKSKARHSQEPDRGPQFPAEPWSTNLSQNQALQLGSQATHIPSQDGAGEHINSHLDATGASGASCLSQHHEGSVGAELEVQFLQEEVENAPKSSDRNTGLNSQIPVATHPEISPDQAQNHDFSLGSKRTDALLSHGGPASLRQMCTQKQAPLPGCESADSASSTGTWIPTGQSYSNPTPHR